MWLWNRQGDQRTADTLRQAIRLQQERIDSQVEIIAQAEGRNAHLEWGMTHYIAALRPATDKRLLEQATRLIRWN